MSRGDERARVVSNEGGTPLPDRMLGVLGFDRVFIDAVLGDLAEERALRVEKSGALPAGAWHAREVARSLPHWILTAFRRGDLHMRLRIAGVLAFLVSLAASVVIAFITRDGPPAAIVLGNGDPVEGVVINNAQPTQLQTSILDARGHRLSTDPVQFTRVSGASIALSPNGVIHCERNADAIVRATVRGVDADLAVHCRPVRELRTSDWIDLMLGQAPLDLPFVAIGVDGRAVTQLRGVTDVSDTSIAALEGTKLRARAPGATDVTITIGDRRRKRHVIVHTFVASFIGLRDNQKHVAIPIRLARGDTVRLALPLGVYWVKYLPRLADDPPPSIELGGGPNCGASDGLRNYRVVADAVMTYCVVERAGAFVTLGHGMGGAPLIEGALALDRVDDTPRR